MTHTEYNRVAPQVVDDAVRTTEYHDWRIEDVDYIEQPADYINFYEVELEQGDADVDLYISTSGEVLKQRPQMTIPVSYL